VRLELALRQEFVLALWRQQHAATTPGLRRSRGCTVLPGWVVGGGIAQPTGAAGVDVTWQTCWVVSSWVVTGPSRVMLWASDGRDVDGWLPDAPPAKVEG
jgi:hypothetical protein